MKVQKVSREKVIGSSKKDGVSVKEESRETSFPRIEFVFSRDGPITDGKYAAISVS